MLPFAEGKRFAGICGCGGVSCARSSEGLRVRSNLILPLKDGSVPLPGGGVSVMNDEEDVLAASHKKAPSSEEKEMQKGEGAFRGISALATSFFTLAFRLPFLLRRRFLAEDLFKPITPRLFAERSKVRVFPGVGWRFYPQRLPHLKIT